MTSAESTSHAIESDAVDAAVDPNQSEDSTASTVSWGPSENHRLQSFGAGGLLATVGLASAMALTWVPALLTSEWFSVDLVLSIGLLVLVFGPVVANFRKAIAEEAAEREQPSLREQLDWSEIQPFWGGCGAVVAATTLWVLRGVPSTLYGFQLAALFAALLFQGDWNVTTTVDPAAGVIETDRPSYTRRRSLDYTVRVRRFDLLNRSLFVFSNRGKQWFKGPHMLSVPAEVAPEVDPLLRRMVDHNDEPPRIGRDERLIIGGVGASMLGIGPLLYLLSGEGALLLIAAGPSAIVAHFALMHAHRG